MQQQATPEPGPPVRSLRTTLLWVLLGLIVACGTLVMHAPAAQSGQHGGAHPALDPGAHPGPQSTAAAVVWGGFTPHGTMSAPATSAGLPPTTADRSPSAAGGEHAGPDCVDCSGGHHLGLAVACLVAAAVTLLLRLLPARPRTVLRRAGREARAGPPSGVVHLIPPRPPDLAELCIRRT